MIESLKRIFKITIFISGIPLSLLMLTIDDMALEHWYTLIFERNKEIND